MAHAGFAGQAGGQQAPVEPLEVERRGGQCQVQRTLGQAAAALDDAGRRRVRAQRGGDAIETEALLVLAEAGRQRAQRQAPGIVRARLGVGQRQRAAAGIGRQTGADCGARQAGAECRQVQRLHVDFGFVQQQFGKRLHDCAPLDAGHAHGEVQDGLQPRQATVQPDGAGAGQALLSHVRFGLRVEGAAERVGGGIGQLGFAAQAGTEGAGFRGCGAAGIGVQLFQSEPVSGAVVIQMQLEGAQLDHVQRSPGQLAAADLHAVDGQAQRQGEVRRQHGWPIRRGRLADALL